MDVSVYVCSNSLKNNCLFDKVSTNDYCKFKANKVRFKAITSVKKKNIVFGMYHHYSGRNLPMFLVKVLSRLSG